MHSSLSRAQGVFGFFTTVALFVAGVAAYATYQKGTHFRDEVIGLTYAMNKNSQLNLSWKNYDDNNGATFKGIGGGVNWKF